MYSVITAIELYLNAKLYVKNRKLNYVFENSQSVISYICFPPMVSASTEF